MDRFAREELDLVVLEVGLGGRLDATTAHPDRRVVGFGPIGLDHQDVLGSTLAEIAAEKAGVLTASQVAISGPQAPAVVQVLEQQAQRSGCVLHWVEPLAGEAAGGLPLGLPGTFQRSNGAVAMAMAETLIAQGWPISKQAIAMGLRQARWPGRLELRRWQGREVLLDGAHNPPSAEALKQELNQLDQGAQGEGQTPAASGSGGRRWLLAMQRTKDAPALLDALLGPHDRAAIVALADLPCWSVDALLAARPELAGRLQAVAHPQEGLRWLSTPGPLPVVAGSLHLLGEIWPLLDPPEPGDQVAGRICRPG
jgi:dihydrofolate synthase/folylpolyglutamate synthase